MFFHIVGYSVQIAQGSGLVGAPSFPPPAEAYPVGARQSDEISEMGNTSTSILSQMEKKGKGDDDDSNTGNGDIPVAQVMGSSAAAAGRSSEPEIYIPPAPQQDIYIPAAPGAKTTGLNNDNDDDFENLKARFANLKR